MTPNLGRDPPGSYPMSGHQFHVATSFLPTVGFFRSRHKNPGRNLPHCLPCRDLKMMSRPQIGLPQLCYDATPFFHVATSLLLSQNSPGRNLKKGAATPISIGQPESGRDIKVMSRHQISSAPLATPKTGHQA